MPLAVALATAAISAGVGVYSANKAAKSQQRTTDQIVAGQDRIRSDVQPYLSAGTEALGRISNPNAMLANFQASPDYQYRLGRSLDGVTQNRAVSGLLRSGSALRGVTEAAGNMASGEFSNWWNRQSGLASQGIQAEGVASGAANQTAQALQNNATTQGGAALANGNTINTAVGSIGDLISRYGAQAANTAAANSPGAQGFSAGSSYGASLSGGW